MSLRQVFTDRGSYVETGGLENIYNFTLKFFVFCLSKPMCSHCISLTYHGQSVNKIWVPITLYIFNIPWPVSKQDLGTYHIVYL